MKSYKYISSLIPLIILAISCSQGNKCNSIDLSSARLLNLTLVSGNHQFLSPQALFEIGDMLVITDKFDNQLVTLLSKDCLDKSRRLINVGNGPHEFLKISNLVYSPIDSTIWIDDNMRRRFSKYSLTDNLELSDSSYLLDVSYRSLPNAMTLVPSLSGFLANGSFNNGRYALFDYDLNMIEEFGSLENTSENESMKAYAMIHQSEIACDPSGMYFCAAEVYSDRIEFYKKDYTRYQFVTSYQSYEPDVDVISHSVNGNEYIAISENDKTLRGFREIFATENHFYALYWGIKPDSMNESENCCYIVMFSLDGEELEVYKVDALLRSIAIDERNRELYAIDMSPSGNDNLYFCYLDKMHEQ